jgi:hypothetical protein
MRNLHKDEELSQQQRTDNQMIVGFGRAPLVHLILLSQLEKQTKRHATRTEEYFLDKGVDVYCQQPPLTNSEQLPQVLATSTSDYVVVIGDRNAKNNTCHVKKCGNLQEMEWEAAHSMIIKSWPQNPQKCRERLLRMEDCQVESLLFKYGGVNRLYDRLERLRLSPVEQAEKRVLFLRAQLANCQRKIEALELHDGKKRGMQRTAEYKPNAQRIPRCTIAQLVKDFLLEKLAALKEKFLLLVEKLPISLSTGVEETGSGSSNSGSITGSSEEEEEEFQPLVKLEESESIFTSESFMTKFLYNGCMRAEYFYQDPCFHP